MNLAKKFDVTLAILIVIGTFGLGLAAVFFRHAPMTAASGRQNPLNQSAPDAKKAQVAITSSTIGRIQQYDLSFLYPIKPGAIWIDLPSGELLYRYPYDPERDSDITANAEYRPRKDSPAGIYFLFKVDRVYDESLAQYVDAGEATDLTGNGIDLTSATSFTIGSISGYTLQSSGDPGNPYDISIFKNTKCDTAAETGCFFVTMINESNMLTYDEFEETVRSAIPTLISI